MSLLFQPTNICTDSNSSLHILSLKEETPELNFITESSPIAHPFDDLMSAVLSTFKKEKYLTLKEKLDFSYLLSIAVRNFKEEMVKEFNEEECHLVLLNWVWSYGKKMKEFQFEKELKYTLKLNQNFDKFFPNYNILLIEINFILQLLINILYIFIFLPISSNEILNLKLYEKLSKIKNIIKFFAQDELLNLIDIVLNNWKNQIDAESEEKIIARFKLNNLGVKRNRTTEEKIEEQATEADSVDNDSSIYIINNINNIKNINVNKKNKKNKISFDLSKNSVIYYKKDDMPFQITLDKQNQLNVINPNCFSSIK